MSGLAAAARCSVSGCSGSSGSRGSGMGSGPGGGSSVRPHGPRCCMAIVAREPHSTSGTPSRGMFHPQRSKVRGG
eukprot:4240046-Prorocentrum_lima.AAC.1